MNLTDLNYTYIAVMVGLMALVYLMVRWIVRARRRFGWPAAWLVILLEACGVGAVIYAAVKNVPGMGDTMIGQQLILAIVGIGLAVVIGGGLVMALGRR